MPVPHPQFWLMKSEPDVFSISDLEKKQKTLWDGVRNYMARNYMMKQMRPNDLVLFYHSNAKPSGVAGLAKVASAAQPDPSAFNKTSKYYDAKSTKEKPRWYCVELAFFDHLPQFVSLEQVKGDRRLQNMVLLNNSRLSVQPVTKNEFLTITEMAKYKFTEKEKRFL